MTELTNAEKGIANGKKLKAYIKTTPLEKIPTNQYGSASQKKILESIGIASSNRNADPIKEEFKKLNDKLGAAPIVRSSSGNSDEVRTLKQTISKLQDRLAALKAENEALKAKQLGEDWFVETGRMVRF